MKCVKEIIVTSFCVLMMLNISKVYATAFTTRNIGVLVNESDPESVALGQYYLKARGIPEKNLVRIRTDGTSNSINSKQVKKLLSDIRLKSGPQIKGWAIAWSRPFRAGCMSITSAIAMGYDSKYCAIGCRRTSISPWFNTGSSDQGRNTIKPAMLLAGKDLNAAKKLIDRGITSDYSRPYGSAYLLSTTDRQRNVRASKYMFTARMLGAVLPIRILKQDAIENKQDVLFYFTGLKYVSDIRSLKFLPGAVADHLTSTGGVLFGGRQMSSLEWLDAGATGSYGTVVEPCNFMGKFPVPGILMENYLNGDTLLNAYWKSVQMPGQGVFIGEPLAKPWGGCELVGNTGGMAVTTRNRVTAENFVLLKSKNCGSQWRSSGITSRH